MTNELRTRLDILNAMTGFDLEDIVRALASVHGNGPLVEALIATDVLDYAMALDGYDANDPVTAPIWLQMDDPTQPYTIVIGDGPFPNAQALLMIMEDPS